jgi:anthranilate phosphoribosyltransferase
MKAILEHVLQHKTLSRTEAAEVLREIAAGKYDTHQIAAFLTAFIMRNITLQELQGFRDGLLSLCHRVDVSDYRPMDVCGTGGDGRNTFNISTLSAFVVAGAGIPVVKHGNYGVSSVSGSSNVLEQLGFRFTTEEARLRQQLEVAGICFLHAPLFHPAMKVVGPVRKALGVKTFFNMLGPLVNPAQPEAQLVGVFSLELARMYQYILQESRQRYSIVHSLDGADEITLTSDSKIYSPTGENILRPADLGYDTCTDADLFGGETVAEAAVIFIDTLRGRGTKAREQVVLANSALAIQTYYPKLSLEAARDRAAGSLRSGQALASFERLKHVSQ